MRIRLLITQYIGFTTIGLVASIIGPMLSAIREDIPMSYSMSGIILSGQFLGILLSVLAGGYLADKYGKKPFLMAGGILLCLGLLGSMFSAGYIPLLLFTLLSGTGFGAYEVGINAMCSDSNESNKGSAMNYLHFFYGVGAMLGPVLVTLSLSAFHSWRLVFGLVAIFPVAVMILLKPVTISIAATEHENTRKPPYKSWLLWVTGLFIFVYVGIETSMQCWIPSFWEKAAPGAFIPASLIASIFWLFLTLGRLVSGKAADRLGLSKFLLLTSFGSAVIATIWVFTRFMPGTLFAVLMLGFLLAGIFPTTMASSISYLPGLSATVTAFVACFGAIGGFIMPATIGKVADTVGITTLPMIIFAMTLLLVLLAAYRDKLLSESSPNEKGIV